MGNQVDPTTYQIVVKGGLDVSWNEWFGNLGISVDDEGFTVLTGPVADQAALRGILSAVWDLNLVVIAVKLIERNPKHEKGGYHV